MTPPKLLITLGDVAGIGPEIVAKAWPRLTEFAVPVVVGDPAWVRRGGEAVGLSTADIPVENPSAADLSGVRVGEVSAAAGRAAFDWLTFAIDECLAGRAAGIVTCPLNKEGLHAAGVPFPGHTEILADRSRVGPFAQALGADRCGAAAHAMLLFDDALGLAVAHVTLHTRVRDVFPGITRQTVLDKIRLLHAIVPRLTGSSSPRIGVGALNPHASDGGLFGDEEATAIAPAVADAVREGIAATGPIAADAIFLPHNRAKFDGIVSMIHDHGHVAMKLLGGRRAVNVTAGLPIVRTSVAHGTAYDIAGTGTADESSLVSAVRVAARLAS